MGDTTVPKILGRKVGMSQIFGENLEVVPVTVIEAGPCDVIQVKTKERDGYVALQVGFGERKKNVRKPDAGHFARAGVAPRRWVREIRFDEATNFEAGQRLTLASLGDLTRVDVQGVSKGKGTTGVVKRWGFHGLPATHGTKDRQRCMGSNGAGTYPGRVVKGKKMAGRMGNVMRTVRNLPVVQVDGERNLLLVRGAVPGPNGGFVVIRRSPGS